MTRIKLLVCCFFLFASCKEEVKNEAYYSKLIQSQMGGELEVTVVGGRVDLLTSEVAYEIEWAHKWKESIGQSIWYSIQTNKKPGIILILRNRNDYKYVVRLNTAIAAFSTIDSFKLHVYPNDFD